MTFPFSDLPTNRTNDTLTVNTHPADHNQANAALNALKAVLGAAPQGDATDLTERLELLDDLDGVVAELVASGALRSGIGEPAADLGKPGDFYVNTSSYTIYGPRGTGGSPWGSPQSLIGPQGDTGPAGGNITAASQLPYDNLASGLTATDVQAAIDEVEGDLGTLDGVVGGLIAGADGETLDLRASVTTNQTLDAAAASVFVLDLFGSVDVFFETANLTAGRAYGMVIVTQQGIGQSGKTVTWPTGQVRWPKGVQPSQTTGTGGRDSWVFFTVDGGTTWFGFQSGSNLS
jgi:hypothetical protein